MSTPWGANAVHKKSLLSLGQLGSWQYWPVIVVVTIMLAVLPVMAGTKSIPTTRPCTETVTENCVVIPPLDPTQRAPSAPQQQAQPQSGSSTSARGRWLAPAPSPVADGGPDPSQIPVTPPSPMPGPEVIDGPGFSLDFSSGTYQIGPMVIHAPPVVQPPIVTPPPEIPGYASPEAPPSLGWVNGQYLSCDSSGCVANDVAANGINVLQFQGGPVTVALMNGVPVTVVAQNGSWLQIIANCPLEATNAWSVIADIPLLACVE